MASAWGSSWGSSWASSWGTLVARSEVGGGSGLKSKRRYEREEEESIQAAKMHEAEENEMLQAIIGAIMCGVIS